MYWMRVFGNGRLSWMQFKMVGDTQSSAAHRLTRTPRKKVWHYDIRPFYFRVREWLLFSDLQINQEQQDPKEKEHSSVIREITSCKHTVSHTLKEELELQNALQRKQLESWLRQLKQHQRWSFPMVAFSETSWAVSWCAVGHRWLAEPESAAWQD